MPEAQQLLERAQSAVAKALAAGADDAVAGANWGRSSEFAWRDGRVEKVQENLSQSLAVSIYANGRYSRHGTNDLRDEQLEGFLAEAVALTKLLEPDPYRKITPPELYEGRSTLDLQLLHPSVADFSREQRLRWCSLMEEHARKHDAVISVTGGVEDGYGISARASSNGFAGAQERASAWYGCSVTVRVGEHKRPEAYRWVGGLSLEGLPTPEEVGAEALRRVLARIGSKRIPSLRTTMVVDREAAGGLVGRLLGALSAGAVQQERSFLAGKMGEQVASKVLSITDDPLIPGGMGSRLYDGEGIAAVPRPIIEDGVLRSFFVDTYYGRKLGWAPTSGSASNLMVSLGDQDAAGLLKQVGEGIYVTSWLGGNADSTTGDFSFGIRGHRIEGGEVGEPVGEMNVTGNLLDLMQQMTVLGNDPVPWSSFRCPSVVFENIQYSGS